MTWDWDYTFRILPDLLAHLWVTIQAVIFGMALALVVGLVWAVARRSSRAWISRPVGALVEFIRRTPLLVQLYFLYYLTAGSDVSLFLMGVLGLGLHYSTYTSEVYRAGIEGVGKGQWDAALALNLTRAQTYRRIVLPQAIPPVIPALGNYLIAMFKDTPLLIAIQVPEVLSRAKELGAVGFRYLEPYTLVGFFYLVLSVVSGLGVERLERRYGRSAA